MNDWIPTLFAVALCVGSFLGTLIYRLPAGQSFTLGRSACLNCGHKLVIRDLVPILSWLLNRGRCRHCFQSISFVYPVVELMAAVIAIWAVAVLPGWLAVAGCVLGWALLTMAIIDLRERILPDELTLPLIPIGIAIAWFNDAEKVHQHILGAIGGYLFVLVVRFAYRRLNGKEAMGLGDAKLMAVGGAWLAWQGLPSILFLASSGALVVEPLRNILAGKPAFRGKLAFGPYLALAIWIVWLYGPLVVE